MIIVKLKGGLGNQMFQYALGRKLALQNTDLLKIDAEGLKSKPEKDTPRKYALSPFLIKEEFATPEEIKKIKYPLGFFSKMRKAIDIKILRNFNIDFDVSILKRRGDIYLDGFWQSEKYFKDIRKELLNDFTLRKQMGYDARNISQVLSNDENSISLHIRRGDYVNDKKTQAVHGNCSLEYYINAAKLIVEKIGQAHFYIFSDDISWVKKNLKLPFPSTYVSRTSIADYEEMILMNSCKHNIIANSSFSWWGAWLNKNPEKMVIAPRSWLAKGDGPHKNIIPSNWIRIENHA